MIYLVYGSQGSGKTLFLAKKGFDAYNSGQKVYSNFKLNYPHTMLNYDDMINCKLQNACVLIDEAHIFGFDARESMSRGNKELVKQWIIQLRKRKVNLFASSQRPRQLDGRLKSNSDYALQCSKFVFDKEKKRLIQCTQSMDFPFDVPIVIHIDIVRGDDGKEASVNIIANHCYKLYNTNEVIKLSNQQKETVIKKKHEIIKKKNKKRIKKSPIKKTTTKAIKKKKSKKKK